MSHLTVIADDLTGANDTGLQFLKAGLRTIVAIAGPATDADVLVINTQSRVLPAEQAGALAGMAARRHASPMLYKKMDSTARGNWGAELAAIMATTGLRLALVSPAFPAQGRSVRRSHILLHGLPLEETALARDPTFPMRDSFLPAILTRQGVKDIACVGLDLIETGPAALSSHLRDAAGVVICDAESDAHLQTIALAAARLDPTPLLCGSAGLAVSLPAAFGWPARIISARPSVAGPTLILAGSRNPVTLRQIRVAEAAGIASWQIAPSALAAAPANADFCHTVASHLANGRPAIVAIDAATASLPAQAEPLAAHLAATARHIIAAGRIGAIALTGGDVADAFCQAAGVQAIRLADEILSGIPAGHLLGGELDGLSVATKAGGFGAPDALWRIACYFNQS